MVTTITPANEAEFISNGLAIIDCWASWCGPCKALSPIVNEMAKELPDIKFGKFNIESDDGEFTAKYEIMGVPVLLFFRDGQLIGRIDGSVSKAILRKNIMEIMGL